MLLLSILRRFLQFFCTNQRIDKTETLTRVEAVMNSSHFDSNIYKYHLTVLQRRKSTAKSVLDNKFIPIQMCINCIFMDNNMGEISEQSCFWKDTMTGVRAREWRLRRIPASTASALCLVLHSVDRRCVNSSCWEAQTGGTIIKFFNHIGMTIELHIYKDN